MAGRRPEPSGYISHEVLRDAIKEAIHDAREHLERDIHDSRKHFNDRLDKIERHIRGDIHMATAKEQEQLDRISTSIDTIAEEMAGTAQKILDLMAQHGVDQATIDGMESDVVNALKPIADRAEALANDLADPATPLTPTP